MQILVGTGSDTPKVGICSQCCWTGKSWGLLLATLVSDKLLMGTGDAQIQVFVWVYQGCYLPCVSPSSSNPLPCTSLLVYPDQHQ